MSETLQVPHSIEHRHPRLDEIRRDSEHLIDEIILEAAHYNRDLVKEEEDYIFTSTRINTPYGNETSNEAFSLVELRHGKPQAQDRYQITIRNQVVHKQHILNLGEVTYHFKDDWIPLEAEGINDRGDLIGWKPGRSEELDLQLHLAQALHGIQNRPAVAA